MPADQPSGTAWCRLRDRKCLPGWQVMIIARRSGGPWRANGRRRWSLISRIASASGSCSAERSSTAAGTLADGATTCQTLPLTPVRVVRSASCRAARRPMAATSRGTSSGPRSSSTTPTFTADSPPFADRNRDSCRKEAPKISAVIASPPWYALDWCVRRFLKGPGGQHQLCVLRERPRAVEVLFPGRLEELAPDPDGDLRRLQRGAPQVKEVAGRGDRLLKHGRPDARDALV